MEKVVVGMTLDKPLLEEIDKNRGLIKRSTFINDLLRKSLGVSDKGQ